MNKKIERLITVVVVAALGNKKTIYPSSTDFFVTKSVSEGYDFMYLR
jgi:hypothetical protein